MMVLFFTNGINNAVPYLYISFYLGICSLKQPTLLSVSEDHCSTCIRMDRFVLGSHAAAAGPGNYSSQQSELLPGCVVHTGQPQKFSPHG